MAISPFVRERLATWVPVALALAFVAALTLVPVPHGQGVDDIPFWCLGCGDYALADAVANVVLFVPLGWAMARAGVPWSRGLAVAVLITTSIEGLQYRFIPGRVASIADILANTAGGAVGLSLALVRRQLVQTAERAARAVTVYGVALVACLGLGEVTQAVLAPPRLYWTRGQADGVHYVPFTGSLRELRLNGSPIALDRWLAEPPRQGGGGREDDVAADLTSGLPDTGLAHIVIAWMPSGSGWMWLEQRDRDLHLHIASASDRLGLHGHSVWLRDVMPVRPREPVTVRLVVRRFGYHIVLGTHSGAVIRDARVSPGDGWRLFMPGQRQWGPWAAIWTACWMAALLVPLGYLAAKASPRAVGAAALGAAVCFVLLPLALGSAWPSVPGWCGATSGFLIGCLAGRVTPAGGTIRAKQEVPRLQGSIGPGV